jgi:ABC-type transport system involved in multi-copper enzyme maturation permease subunit
VQRELAIALRARVTWLIAALAALLIGHGFILAIDLYSASSRSALSSVLQTREMDPLAGIVRPTMGGVSLALSLLGPVIAARTLAIEKERRTYGALCLAVGSPSLVVLQKAVAGAAACAILLVIPIVLFLAFAGFGGHVDPIETAVALGGEAMHLLLIVALAIAAAAWTRTFSQAVTLGILASLTSWAIDAAEGFAALAWLGRASQWSIEQRLLPFQRGVIAVGSVLWLICATALSLGAALAGGSFSRTTRKLMAAALVLGVGFTALALTGTLRRGFDWSEQRRASLPPAAVDGLRRIAAPIAIDVLLDRDDSRRRQLESDALSKLLLARSDVSIRTPLDDSAEVAPARRDSDYGRIVVRVGGEHRETRSTSRRELITLIFDAAGQQLPEWTQSPYSGFPVVLDGVRRRVLGVLAYAGLPLLFVVFGLVLTHRRTTR